MENDKDSFCAVIWTSWTTMENWLSGTLVLRLQHIISERYTKYLWIQYGYLTKQLDNWLKVATISMKAAELNPKYSIL